MSTAETKVGLSTSAAFVAVAVCLAMASAGCFEGGEFPGNGDTRLVIGGDSGFGDAADGSMSSGADAGVDGQSREDASAVDVGPCGGCDGDNPVCDDQSGKCVECLKNADCPDDDKSVCNTDTNTCVACLPKNEKSWYPDQDNDGFGEEDATPTKSCKARMMGMVANDDDCDDTLKGVNPSAREICNGRDDNCSGTKDDISQTGSEGDLWYVDCDGDGFTPEMMPETRKCSKPSNPPTTQMCGASIGTWTKKKPGNNNLDCDDGKSGVNPSAKEICDDIDNDCDGFVDGWALGCPNIVTFGTQAKELPADIAVDSANGFVVGGSTRGALGGSNNAGKSDAFLMHFDHRGKQQWTKQLGTPERDTVTSLDIGPNGNIYVLGRTAGNLVGQTNSGQNDAFIAKFDANGNRLWLRLLGTSKSEEPRAIVATNSGKLYAGGGTNGSLSGSNKGSFDAFLAEFDTSGNRQAVDQFGSGQLDFVEGVAVDGSGRIYLAGMTNGVLPNNTGVGARDSFVARYDYTGNRKWISQFGSSALDSAADVKVGPNGKIHVVGGTDGSIGGKFHQAGGDAYWAMFDTKGNRTSVDLVGSNGVDVAASLAFAAGGDFYVVGRTDGNVKGNPPIGKDDALVVKFQNNSFQWANNLGTQQDDTGRAAATNSNGRLYVVGATEGNLDGNTNRGSLDGFIAW